ncbi:Ig-like domain-containing protein [Fulvivirga lutea]|uniref:Ig-like domain-containing protein n=1 Tax=Fulvivirga lutea TaxID=2810512 RepID=A0A974WKJ2_9BACT|nr:Ig-like domain-containing protein [Fulvivirga lutea]QSE97053.1 Ig-like domain-containing protein [Fulvivirga lutea]
MKRLLAFSLSTFFLLALLITVGCSSDEDEDPGTNNGGGTSVDEIQPSVLSVSPVDGATNVSVNSFITISFSEPIDIESVTNTSVILSGGISNSVQANVSISGSTMTIDPTENLEFEEEYLLRLSTGLTDLAGNSLISNFSTRFTTQIEPDNTPPTVVSITPSNGASNVSVNTQIIVEFSEPVENIGFETFKIRKSGESGSLDGSGSFSGNSFIYTLDEPLAGATTYSIFVGTGITDLAGNNLPSNIENTFSTESVIFSIQSTSFENEAEDMEIDDISFSITFEADIDPSTVNSNTFKILLERITAINGTISVEGPTITFTPSTPLEEFEQLYSMWFDGAAIKDVNGNPYEYDYPIEFEFTTVFLSDLYWYRFRNASLGDGIDIAAATDGAFQLFYATTGNFCNVYWTIQKQNNGYFTFTHQCANNRYLEAASPNDGNPAYMQTLPSGGGFFSGQLWKFTPVTFPGFANGNFYTMSSLSLGTGLSLDRNQFDMVSTSGADPDQFWRFIRANKK